MHEISIILAAVNARYSHTSFGMRNLRANLGPFRAASVLREFATRQSPAEIAKQLLTEIETSPIGTKPLIALGVYIWNRGHCEEIVRRIKSEAPTTLVVLGGPEIAYDYEATMLFRQCDYLIRGEGELVFAKLVADIAEGNLPTAKVLEDKTPDPMLLASPYDEYTEDDIAHRMIYVESSRGCPFSCAFCMSAQDRSVRTFSLDDFLSQMQSLLDRGVRHFRFVDRTFNLSAVRVLRVLDFFYAHAITCQHEENRFARIVLHFEIMPDRLPQKVLDKMTLFPPGSLHLEVGVQSFNTDTLAAIGRRQNLKATTRNLQFLRTHTKAEIHADLIAGLPCEGWDSFAAGFDRLVMLRPQELQLGILKRLRGAPITKIEQQYGLQFSEEPPYEVIRTAHMSGTELLQIKRMAHCFELVHNRGRFPETLPLLLQDSPFANFMALSEFIFEKAGRMHGIAYYTLVEYLYAFLCRQQRIPEAQIACALKNDFYRKPGRKEYLSFLDTSRPEVSLESELAN